MVQGQLAYAHKVLYCLFYNTSLDKIGGERLTTCALVYAAHLVANVEDLQELATFLEWDGLCKNNEL